MAWVGIILNHKHFKTIRENHALVMAKHDVCVCIIYSYNNEGTIGYRNSNTNIRKKMV